MLGGRRYDDAHLGAALRRRVPFSTNAVVAALDISTLYIVVDADDIRALIPYLPRRSDAIGLAGRSSSTLSPSPSSPSIIPRHVSTRILYIGFIECARAPTLTFILGGTRRIS